MRFAWIHVEKATYAVRRLCRVLAVTPSGYYAWMHRLPSQRARDNDRLQVRIRAIHAASRGTYGSPRVHEQLTQEGLCGGAGACRATVAGHGARRPARETRPAHHRQHARPARRPQRARTSLRGRPSKPAVDHRHHLHLDVGGLAVSGGRARPVRAPRRRVGRAAAPADGAGPGGAAAGAGATRARPRSGAPFRSGLPG